MKIFTNHRIVACLIALLLLILCHTAYAAKRIVLKAADGVRVYASEYPAPAALAPIVLLFHQAGSNKAEYETIAPHLVALGFHCLAVDQRSGGARWGVPNETVLHLGRSTEYLIALRDLEAVLIWANRENPSHKPIVWGSSYSAALVFLLAAAHPNQVGALLAFSPGEYLGSANRVRDAARQVSVPVYVTSALSGGEEEAARTIWQSVPSHQKSLFVPRRGGIHASSTLRRELNPAGYDENWAAVTRFLKSLKV